MAVDQLPAEIREFAGYLDDLMARLDQGGGWCAVFWGRDPDGMRACLDGREVPPWDVVEALLQDLATAYGPDAAEAEQAEAQRLHTAALTAYDARPGARDALSDRLDIMLREQRYATERQVLLGRSLATASTPEQVHALRVELAWARDDHRRASARCAELRSRLAELSRPDGGNPGGGPGPVRRGRADEPYTRAPVFEPGGPTGGRGFEVSGRTDGRGFEVSGHTDGHGFEVSGRTDGHGFEASGHTDGRGFEVSGRADGTGLPADRHGAGPGSETHRLTSLPVQAPPTSADTAPAGPDTRFGDGGHQVPDAPAGRPPASGSRRAGRTETGKPRKRRRGSARFAGMAEDETVPAVVPQTLAPVLPAAVPEGARVPRGARFAGAPEETRTPEEPPGRPDPQTEREVFAAVDLLRRLRAEGRSGEAHALLADVARWPAVRLPLLAEVLHDAGLGADWTTLLWEAAALPADLLVAAADALESAGRTDDGQLILRQGVARSAEEIGEAALRLASRGHHRELRALLDAYVRVRTPEEAARSAGAGPGTLVPLLLEAAQGVSDERHWDLVHALRVAGFAA